MRDRANLILAWGIVIGIVVGINVPSCTPCLDCTAGAPPPPLVEILPEGVPTDEAPAAHAQFCADYPDHLLCEEWPR